MHESRSAWSSLEHGSPAAGWLRGVLRAAGYVHTVHCCATEVREPTAECSQSTSAWGERARRRREAQPRSLFLVPGAATSPDVEGRPVAAVLFGTFFDIHACLLRLPTVRSTSKVSKDNQQVVAAVAPFAAVLTSTHAGAGSRGRCSSGLDTQMHVCSLRYCGERGDPRCPLVAATSTTHKSLCVLLSHVPCRRV